MSNGRHWLVIKVTKFITVQFHVLQVLDHCQSDQPNKINQQERPICWNQENLKPCATQRYHSAQQQIFPQVELVQRTQYRTIALYTMQYLLAFLNEQTVLEGVFVRVGQPRRGEILNDQIDYVEAHEVHEAKVFIVKYAVEDVCVEKGQITPALSTIYGSMIQYCLPFAKGKMPIGNKFVHVARIVRRVHQRL